MQTLVHHPSLLGRGPKDQGHVEQCGFGRSQFGSQDWKKEIGAGKKPEEAADPAERSVTVTTDYLLCAWALAWDAVCILSASSSKEWSLEWDWDGGTWKRFLSFVVCNLDCNFFFFQFLCIWNQIIRALNNPRVLFGGNLLAAWTAHSNGQVAFRFYAVFEHKLCQVVLLKVTYSLIPCSQRLLTFPATKGSWYSCWDMFLWAHMIHMTQPAMKPKCSDSPFGLIPHPFG